jgi:lipopolysaccharide transport system permease protein
VETIVITPPGRLGLPRWSELWGAREVLFRFGQRDVLLRYRQTAVGVLWVFLQPLASAGVFAIVFGQVAGLPSQGVPYFLFSYAGMLAWNLFNQVVGRAAPSLVSNQALVSKVFFPRMLVPMSAALAVLLDFAVALVLGVVLLFLYGVNPGWPVLLLPVWVLLLLACAMGIGLAASSVQVKYRDVGYALPWALQLLLYASPVAYSIEAIQDLPPAVRALFEWNPMTWYLEAFRWSFLGLDAPHAWQVVGMVLVSAVVLLAGILVFQKNERLFADVI